MKYIYNIDVQINKLDVNISTINEIDNAIQLEFMKDLNSNIESSKDYGICIDIVLIKKERFDEIMNKYKFVSSKQIENIYRDIYDDIIKVNIF